MGDKQGIARELHKQARRNYSTRSVELKGLDDLYQADLVEMIQYSRFNKGYKYILTIINCFSKFAFAFPLKSKNADDVVKVLKPIFHNHKMKHFQTDDGKEWFNSKLRSILIKFNINHYSTYSDKKASIVERFNRTLKTNMWRKFTEQGDYRWVNILDEIVEKYNNRVHRTTGFKPKDVSYKNEREVLLNISKAVKKRHQHIAMIKFNVGDQVRISRYKKTFAKGYLPNWTNEVFTIYKVKQTQPITYVLKDGKGEVLKGSFYTEELSKTKYGNVYLVEKVLKRRGDKLFVRWLGFDKKEDSWIDKKDLIK